MDSFYLQQNYLWVLYSLRFNAVYHMHGADEVRLDLSP